jgi:DNA-directed RNA polymerase specialized sigma24 family protein
MRNPDEFDAFYKDARDRLLLQTYALTGDLPASRSAVRDSFVVAWHHWRKVSRLDDPESWVRPHAWAHAQRRHTARLRHRDRGLGPEVRATLDALAKLPMTQRKTLLLTHLSSVSMADMAREVGLPRAEAERELQTATAQFAVHRDVATTSIRALFEPLREHIEFVRWPRSTIIRRAGARRRRTHTAVGAVGAVAALVLTGVLVTDAAGVRPSLHHEDVTATATEQRGSAARARPTPAALPESAMLTAEQVGADVAGKKWREGDTSENTEGDGLVLPCQQSRYADPHGAAALLRTFDTPHRNGTPSAAAYQATEVSASDKAAGRTFDQALGWYAGCTEPRVQLLSTQQVDRVGDEAMLVVLRAWKQPSTLVVGVARTGRVTTTTLAQVPGAQAPDLDRSARLLAQAVDGLCDLPGGGTCAKRPRHHEVPPVPVGQVPGMLGEVDLPPLTGVVRPWVGTEPRKAVLNVAATSCDKADFSAPPMTNNLTRYFGVPGAKLPDQFGLTETVGSMPAARAHAFVENVRAKLAACPDKDLGTDVTPMAHVSTKTTDLSVWHVRTEITDKMSVDFLMGIVRDGTSIAQVGFVPSGKVTMAPGAFPALVHRALDRVSALPAPRSGG